VQAATKIVASLLNM